MYILNYDLIKLENEKKITNILTGQSIKFDENISKLFLFLRKEKSIEDISKFISRDISETKMIIEELQELKFVSKGKVKNDSTKITQDKNFQKKETYFDYSSKISKINQICILGLPFDICSTGLTGSKQAPIKLREVLAGYSTRISRIDDVVDNYLLSSKIFYKNIVDLGNFNYIPGESVYSYHNKLENYLINLREKWTPFIFGIGGDHSVTYPLIKSIKEEIILVKLDAHFDSYYKSKGIPINHNNFVYELKRNNIVNKVIHIGIREANTPNNIISDKDVIITSDELKNEKWKQKLLKIIKNKKIYISIDVDVFDPQIFKSTGFILPFGISNSEFDEILKLLLSETKILGIDIVEYNPLLDSSKEYYFIVNILRKLILQLT